MSSVDSMKQDNRKRESIDVGVHTSHINSSHVQ